MQHFYVTSGTNKIRISNKLKIASESLGGSLTGERLWILSSLLTILLPDPAAMAKDDVEAEVEASVGGSRFDGTNGSEALGWLAGGCWMVWMQWPPSMEGRLCGPSKSYSSFTISPELDAEVVSVRPDKSEEKRKEGSVCRFNSHPLFGC